MNHLPFAVLLLLTATAGINLNYVALVGLLATIEGSSKKRTSIIAANLSVTSIGVQLLDIVNWTTVITNDAKRKWPFPAWLCGLYQYGQTAALYNLSITLMAIAKDRYDSTRYIQRTNKWSTIVLSILALWTVSGLLAIPELFFYHSENDFCANSHVNETLSNAHDIVKITFTLPVPVIVTAFYYVKVYAFYSSLKIPEMQLAITGEQRRLIYLMALSTILFFAASGINSIKILSDWALEISLSDTVLLIKSLITNLGCFIAGLFPIMIERAIRDLLP